MTPDLNENVTPLALRVAPFEGEAWPAYLERTADEYQCHPATLVEPISRRWANRLHRGRTACTSGISMTRPVAEATAQRLNLTGPEVLAMQMAAHQGITVSLDKGATTVFDPVFGTARASDVGRVGWIAHPRWRRWCPLCDRERPDVDVLIWRYPWVTACLKHEALLRPCAKGEPDNATPPEWEDLIDTQADLEDILAGRRSFHRVSVRDGFTELLAATAVLASRRGSATLEPTDVWQPSFMASLLPDAFIAVETPIDEWPESLNDLIRDKHKGAYLNHILQKFGATSPFGLRSDLTRYVNEPGHFLDPWARDIRIPSEHRPLVTPRTRVAAMTALPRMLPEHLVVPALTDFTPWLSTRDVQIAAAQAAFMLATGGTLKEACDHLNWPGTRQVPLRRLWWHLESTGQFGDYLETLHGLSQALQREANQGMWRSGAAAE